MQSNFNVPQEQWATFNDDDRRLFSKIFDRERQRRDELILRLDPDCRSTVQEHFDNILGTIVADVIQQTQLQMT